MPTFRVAHICEQSVELLVVLVGAQFGRLPPEAQRRLVAKLQSRAEEEKLIGEVIPVWDEGGGRMAFLAPEEYHPFFESIDLKDVEMNVNRQLTVHL